MSGDRKSGIPAEVEIPAPVCQVRHEQAISRSSGLTLTITTIFFARPSLMNLATDSTVRLSSVSGGVFSSTGVEASWPIMPRGWRLQDFWFLCRRRRPMIPTEVLRRSL